MPGVRPGVLEASLIKRRPGSIVHAKLSPRNYALICRLKKDAHRSFKDIIWFFFLLFLHRPNDTVNPIPESTIQISFRTFPDFRKKIMDQAWFRGKTCRLFYDDLITNILSDYKYELLVRMLKDQADGVIKVISYL